MKNNEIYISGYRNLNLLSDMELYRYFNMIREGNVEARNVVIESYIRLVLFRVNNRFKFVQYDKDDLVSIGIIGLIKAVDSFDISKKIKFSTYAVRCIDNEILMLLRKMKKDRVVDSIETVIATKDFGEQKLTLGDVLCSEINIEECIMKEQLYSCLHDLVEQYDIREKEIIKMYFGFYDSKIYNQKIIAERFNISQSYVSRVIKRVLIKLKDKLIETSEIEVGENVKKRKLDQ